MYNTAAEAEEVWPQESLFKQDRHKGESALKIPPNILLYCAALDHSAVRIEHKREP